jgi:hypothetical protein
MQHRSPGEGKESNWLPAPAGKFRPVLWCYVPGEALLTNQYELPKVRRSTETDILYGVPRIT